MKGTYHFTASLKRQRLVLDERTLYVQRGDTFEKVIFANEKDAAIAFNEAMKVHYNPRDGWTITKKEMGVAMAPSDNQIIGFQMQQQLSTQATPNSGGKGAPLQGAKVKAPSPKAAKPRIDLGKTFVHASGDHLIVNVDKAGAVDTRHALAAPAVVELCLYGNDSTASALMVLKRKPLPLLSTFVIDCFDRPLALQVGCEVGDLGAVIAGHPTLKRVYVVGDARFEAPIEHIGLQRLSIAANPLALEHLQSSRFAALRSLELVLSTGAAVGDTVIDGVMGLIANCPVLETVSLSGGFNAVRVLQKLAAPGVRVPSRLQLLGRIDDEDAFVAAVAAVVKLAPLRALAVPVGALAEGSMKALKAIVADVSGSETPFVPTVYGVDRFLR